MIHEGQIHLAKSMSFDAIPDIVDDIRDGKMVIVADDEGRENEGDLVMAAEKVIPEAIAFFVRHTSGIICMPMTRERLDQLRLPQMVPDNTETHRTAFTISVDYKYGTTTGISAADRAATIRALANLDTKPEDFTRPGHIFPLRYTEGGVLTRAGHTEASVDLVKLAGVRSPCAVICEVVNDDGTMKRGTDLLAFARGHRLKIGTIADLIRHRFATERSIKRIAEQVLHTEHGDFRLVAYQDCFDKAVHIALVRGRIEAGTPTLVRVHIENTLCDVLLADSGICQWPMRKALQRIAREERGVAVLLRASNISNDIIGHIRCLSAESTHKDDNQTTYLEDQRTVGIGSQILVDLGVGQMRLLSSPKRFHGLGGFGLEIIEYISD
jgi:3,4-dihydroxy 2-butanone 4-phosphate synthase / GTP cyclohydrolase II